jgi:uncharacterized protein (DUF2267 family)
MDFDRMVQKELLARDLNLSPARVAQTVVRTLGERLPRGAARALAARLPHALGRELMRRSAPDLPALDRDDLIEAVAAALDLDDATAEAALAAVLAAIAGALQPIDTREQVIEQLPSDLALLIHSGY